MHPCSRLQQLARALAAAARVSALLAAVALQSPSQAAGSNVSVTLDPPAISTDQAATLTITVRGDQDAYPILPRAPGLEISPVDQSSSVEDIDGTVTATFSRTYRVTADSAGTFSIPPIQVGNFRSQPITLRVSAAGSGAGGAGAGSAGAGGAGGSAGGAGGSAAGGSGSADAGAAEAQEDDGGPSLPFIRIVLPRTHLYEGEQVPIEIKAYFREGVGARLEGPLASDSDAFTVSRLDTRPTQTEEFVKGVPYAVLTWSSVLGTIKSGSYPLNLELPLTISVTVTSPPDAQMLARLRAFFGNQSLDEFLTDSDVTGMFGRVIQKTLTLKSPATTVQVLPLPQQGRPADFNGAVGQFDIDSSVTPAGGAVGDPLTLKLTVSGSGNFSRVDFDGLRPSALWRVYHPEEKLTADDDSQLRGRKSFSQPIVPLQAGHVQVPSLSFSYFDPQSRQYVTRRTQPIAVDVTPAAGTTAAAAAAAAAAASQAAGAASPAAPAAAGGTGGNATAGTGSAPGHYVATLLPLITQRWFLALAAAPVVLMAAILPGAALWERRRGDPRRRRRAAHAAALQRHLQTMERALARGDPQEFFIGARHALQESLAQRWRVSPDAVTEAQIEAELPAQGAALRSIFETAEKATYARASMSAQDLQRWQQLVREQLQQLEAA